MTEVLQANIFFIITSVAVILFTILVSILVFHLIKIVKALRRITERVEAGSVVLAEDLEKIRSSLNVAGLLQFVLSLLPGTRAKNKRATKTSKKEDN